MSGTRKRQCVSSGTKASVEVLSGAPLCLRLSVRAFKYFRSSHLLAFALLLLHVKGREPRLPGQLGGGVRPEASSLHRAMGPRCPVHAWASSLHLWAPRVPRKSLLLEGARCGLTCTCWHAAKDDH